MEHAPASPLPRLRAPAAVAVKARGEGRAADWDILLVSVAGLLLTGAARIHLLFPVLSALKPTLLFAAAALGLFVLDSHPARRLRALASPTSLCLLALVAWAGVTIPFAFAPGSSFFFFLDTFLKTVLIGVIVMGAVRQVRDVERLVFVYFLGAAFYAIIVLVRHDVGGEAWRLQALYTYDPNDFATYAVTALPLGIYFLLRGNGALTRIVASGGLVALSVVFVWSGSRGGFLALAVVALYLLLRYQIVAARWRTAAVGLIFAAMIGFAAGPFWERMGTLLDIEEDYNVTSETGRVQVWKRGLGYLWDRPISGLGLDNFSRAEGRLSESSERARYGLGVRWTPPHNSFLQIATETGLPGLALFLGIYWTLLRALGRIARRSRDGPPDGERAAALAPVLIASILGFAVGSFFLTLAYSDMLYALVGLGAGLYKVTPSEVR